MLKVFDLLPSPLNNSNDTTASGFANARTLQETNAGGLVLGDMFDCDGLFAAQQSYLTNGMLYQGRYRRVQVHASSTAANVTRGKACYVAPGASVLSVLIASPGSGQTPGTYTVTGTGGSPTQAAVIQVVVTAAGTVTGTPTVITAGAGYFATPPTFTLVSGGTVATFQAQMTYNSYIVTDFANLVSGLNTQPRGLFLNAPTPGNYTWIQENGIATFQMDSTNGTNTAGDTLSPVGATVPGAFRTIAKATAPLYSAFGTAIDAPPTAVSLFVRGVMNIPVWNG